LNSYVVTWEDPFGGQHRNQVYAPDRDNAIWWLALLMQTPRSALGKFVSCDLEIAENTPGRSENGPA
jgi:hypothetical protein